VPSDVRWLIKRGLKVEVEASPTRVFSDAEYKKSGARILNRFREAGLLLGIKGPRIDTLYPGRVYMTFSHTIKGQRHNMPLLGACLEGNITLVDYEKIVDARGKRLVYFGRFAGICGLIDSLHYFGKKLEWEGVRNPFSGIRPAYKYASLKEARKAVSGLGNKIGEEGFDKNLSPFIIGITGHGRVSAGVQEILECLNPAEIHPRDMSGFLKHERQVRRRIYKIVFLREEKFRSKNGKNFYFEEYLKNPQNFRSNMEAYLPYINMLIHTSYWDKRYPRMVTKPMIRRLSRKKAFRLKLISDISCDVNGSIELTHKTTQQESPVFTYDPEKETFTDGYRSRGIAILAVDNLPSELPRDASAEFSALIRDYVYQVAAHGAREVTGHVAIPAEVRRAVITEGNDLTDNYRYMAKWLKQKTVLQS